MSCFSAGMPRGPRQLAARTWAVQERPAAYPLRPQLERASPLMLQPPLLLACSTARGLRRSTTWRPWQRPAPIPTSAASLQSLRYQALCPGWISTTSLAWESTQPTPRTCSPLMRLACCSPTPATCARRSLRAARRTSRRSIFRTISAHACSSACSGTTVSRLRHRRMEAPSKMRSLPRPRARLVFQILAVLQEIAVLAGTRALFPRRPRGQARPENI